MKPIDYCLAGAGETPGPRGLTDVSGGGRAATGAAAGVAKGDISDSAGFKITMSIPLRIPRFCNVLKSCSGSHEPVVPLSRA